MTPIALLESLKTFIEENTKDILLYTEHGGEVLRRAAEVHLMDLPDKDVNKNRVPFIVLKFLTGKDDQLSSPEGDSECRIRIVAVTFSEDDGVGEMDVLNLLTRMRVALLKQRVIGEQFVLRLPLEYVVYPEDTSPIHMGEMMTLWELPPVRQDVRLW